MNPIAVSAQIITNLQTIVSRNVTLIPAITGSEDFSFFAQEVPGFYFFVGSATIGTDMKTVGDHHTPQFLMDDSSFKTGVKAMCNLVFDYMELP